METLSSIKRIGSDSNGDAQVHEKNWVRQQWRRRLDIPVVEIMISIKKSCTLTVTAPSMSLRLSSITTCIVGFNSVVDDMWMDLGWSFYSFGLVCMADWQNSQRVVET